MRITEITFLPCKHQDSQLHYDVAQQRTVFKHEHSIVNLSEPKTDNALQFENQEGVENEIYRWDA